MCSDFSLKTVAIIRLTLTMFLVPPKKTIRAIFVLVFRSRRVGLTALPKLYERTAGTDGLADADFSRCSKRPLLVNVTKRV